MRYISPFPAGQSGPAITFGPGANNMVDATFAALVEQAAIASGLSFNINFTTNGVHAPASRHYIGKACDIDRVEGQPAIASNVHAVALQSTFQNLPGIRENFGPAANTKKPGDGTVIPMPQVAADHTTHIHVSSQ